MVGSHPPHISSELVYDTIDAFIDINELFSRKSKNKKERTEKTVSRKINHDVDLM